MSFEDERKAKQREVTTPGQWEGFVLARFAPPVSRAGALIEKIHGQPGVEARLSWAFSIKRVGGTIGSVVQARKVMRLQMESCGGKQKMRRSFSATGLSGRCPSRTR